MNYWLGPDDNMNLPHHYLTNNETHLRSYWFAKYLNKCFPKDINILELGSGTGRNLMHLYGQGFKNIEGIELSPLYLKTCQDYFPHIKTRVDDITNMLLTKHYDIIFTMAVLQHIKHLDPLTFIDHCTQLITIEDEKSNGPRHFARNYKTLFESYSMKQLEQTQQIPGLNNNFILRRFVHT